MVGYKSVRRESAEFDGGDRFCVNGGEGGEPGTGDGRIARAGRLTSRDVGRGLVAGAARGAGREGTQVVRRENRLIDDRLPFALMQRVKPFVLLGTRISLDT